MEQGCSHHPVLGSVTPEDCETQYTSVVEYSRLGKHMTWKRLLGSVKEYQVVEKPLV
jgi:hypothetical protein